MPAKKATSARPEKRAGKILPILRIGSVTLGGKVPLFILGPCVIEGEKPLLRAARTIKAICDDLGAQFIFKASYDKANRTSGSSYRGVGTLDGCRMLAEAGTSIGVPVTTDIHSPEEAAIAAEFIDLLPSSCLRRSRRECQKRPVPGSLGSRSDCRQIEGCGMHRLLFHRTGHDLRVQ